MNAGSIVNNAPVSGGVWNSSKLLAKDPKDPKAALFKSQKYIRDFKAGSIINGANESSVMVKKEEPKWCLDPSIPGLFSSDIWTDVQ